MEEAAFDVNSKYFENVVLPPLPEEDKEKECGMFVFEKKGREDQND